VTDPFEALALPTDRQDPRPAFARELRNRLVTELGLDPLTVLPTIDLPDRRSAMSTTTTTRPLAATGLTPYITVADGPAALDWYAEAFGAVEQLRVVGDDGRIGHAELAIGAARLMLSDEYPEIGVRSPTTLGGSATALHLTVADVDATYARAVAAGATSLMEPADQPHGARHGTLLDPYGHRWMLSQPTETFDVERYRERSQGTGFDVVAPAPSGRGGIWAAVFYADAQAGIRFLLDVLGFEEQLVVVGDDGVTVVHSELRWPEGGIVQVGTYDPGNPYSRDLPPGAQGLYVVTADPTGAWERCLAAGVEVLRPLEAPDYDPTGLGFSVRDPEGNIWSFGTHGLAGP
jgi:PhnB protein